MFQCKIFSGCKIISGENIFGKGKYFQVFGCIMKIILENIFKYLVGLWKCNFPTYFSHFFNNFLSFQTTNFIIENFNNKLKRNKNQNKKINITRPIVRKGQREIGSWVRLAGGQGGSIWRWQLNLGVGHSLGGSIGSWVRGAISLVDEVGQSMGGFVARSRRCWGETCRCLDVWLELPPVLRCAIEEECMWEKLEESVVWGVENVWSEK